jgi:hypothetical protein
VKTKLLILAVGLVGGIGVAGGQALAQPVAQQVPHLPVNPGVAAPVVAGLIVPNMTGTITVTPATPAAPLQGFACSDLVVYATSHAGTPPAPGVPFTPKWTRHVHASGTWSSGTCSYSLFVPPATGSDLPNACAPGTVCTGPVGWKDENSFSLSVSPSGHPTVQCSFGIVGLWNTATPWMSVPKGQTKSYALSDTGTPYCGSLH